MKDTKLCVLLSILLMLVLLLSGCSEQPYHLDDTPIEETAAPTVETIPEDEIIVIPDPEHFFGVDELVFEKFPEAAVKAYYDLMAEQYGFTMKYPDLPVSNWNILTYGETENYNIMITPILRQTDGLILINLFIPDYCREEDLETWDGEIDPYLHNPNHWTKCSACGGSGKCRECYGKGWVDIGFSDTILQTKCKACDGKKKCPNCWGGNIKIDPKDD